MDVLLSAKDLHERLILHEKAVKQILLLEKYVTDITHKALESAILGRTGTVLFLMLRKSAAEGVKRMYKHYRLLKWFQCQMIIHEMNMEYDIDTEIIFAGLGLYPTLNDSGREDSTANSWSVMHCEFTRAC